MGKKKHRLVMQSIIVTPVSTRNYEANNIKQMISNNQKEVFKFVILKTKTESGITKDIRAVGNDITDEEIIIVMESFVSKLKDKVDKEIKSKITF